MNVHDKAIRLLEGGIVEIRGNWFGLLKFPADYDDFPCVECDLDSICRNDHIDVCTECEKISNRRCCLKLALKENSVK